MSEYTDERDRKCPRCGKPLPLEISVRAWHLEECGNYSTRKDKLARIDETARAVLAAQFVREPDLHACYPTTGLDGSRLPDDCAAAYRFALALERARAEAIKEIQ